MEEEAIVEGDVVEEVVVVEIVVEDVVVELVKKTSIVRCTGSSSHSPNEETKQKAVRFYNRTQ